MNKLIFAEALTEMLPKDTIVEGGWEFKDFGNLRFEENPLNWKDLLLLYEDYHTHPEILIKPELFINVEEYGYCLFYHSYIRHWNTKKPYRDIYFTKLMSPYFGFNYFTVPSSINKDFELFEIYQEILTRAVLRVDKYNASRIEVPNPSRFNRIPDYKTKEFVNGENIEMVCFLLEDVGFKMKRYTEGLKPHFFKKFDEDNPILNIDVLKRHKTCRIKTHYMNICDNYVEFGKDLVFKNRSYWDRDRSLRFRIPIPEKIENLELMSSLFKKVLEIVELI